jgi:hypothetical protein
MQCEGRTGNTPSPISNLGTSIFQKFPINERTARLIRISSYRCCKLLIGDGVSLMLPGSFPYNDTTCSAQT